MSPTSTAAWVARPAPGVRRRRPAALAVTTALATALTMSAPLRAEVRPATLPDVIVGAAPLPGTAAALDALPAEIHALEAPGDSLVADPAAALADHVAGIALEDTLSDAWQRSLSFRGYGASPVLGTPQGLAVFQGDVRINEAFGDVVNWDLVPGFAVRRIDVAGASPVFGPGALGGAVMFTMKNAYSDPGGGLAVEAGSFGERAATAEYGIQAGALGLYLGARALDEDGWRDRSSNSLRTLYADLRGRTGRAVYAMSLGAADDRLNGPGAAPLAELAVDRALTFTGPQQSRNRLLHVAASLELRLGTESSLSALAYLRRFRQSLVNGNTTTYAPCVATPGLLCQSDGLTALLGTDGAPITDPSGGVRPLGEIDAESIAATSRGAQLEVAGPATLLGRRHGLALGLSVATANVGFGASAAPGAIDPALQVAAGATVVATPEGGAFPATPVALGVATRRITAHLTDAVALTPALAVTASVAAGDERIELEDQRGGALDGLSRYRRINPALGASYRAGGATLYAGYAETTRAPTPSEIECSDPTRPCLLPSTLAGDPPRLRQVVARTWEVGVRHAPLFGPTGLSLDASAFRADLSDDIYGIATGAAAGYYANIGATRRAGLSLDLRYERGRLAASAGAALVDARFRSTLLMPSPFNPLADANGDITVRDGARLPGIPRLRATAALDWRAGAALTLGATLLAVGASPYHGDESNQNAPLPGYARLDLHARLALGRRTQLALEATNVTNARYATYGLYADPTGVGAPGVSVAPGGVDPRFAAPAAPFALTVGLHVRL